MISNKATPLTEFKLTNSEFDKSKVQVSTCNEVQDDVKLIKNLLSKKECELISNTIFNSFGKREFIQNGLRVHKNSEEFGEIIYDRIKEYCVSKLTRKNPTNSNELLNWEIDSVSSKFRFIQYGEGEQFPNHTDGESKFNEKMSFYSVLIFTNQCGTDFEGGEFRFFKKDSNLKLVELAKVTPETGLCLIFPHNIIHDSNIISKGTKQTIRSDLVYKLN